MEMVSQVKSTAGRYMEQMINKSDERGAGAALSALDGFVAASRVVERVLRRIAEVKGVDLSALVLSKGFFVRDRQIILALLDEIAQNEPKTALIDDLVDRWENNFFAEMNKIKEIK